MKKHRHKKTYSVHELHLKQRVHKKKKKIPSSIDVGFDPNLKEEIETTLLKPYIKESLENFHPTPLNSYEQEHKRKTQEAWKTLQGYVKKIQGGIEALKKVNIPLEINLPEESEENQKMLEAGTAPKEMFKISDEVMNLAYEEACKHYKDKHYLEASNILELLLYLNPAPDTYWQLLGMVEHEAGHFKEAAEALTIGLEKGSMSLLPYAHLIASLADLSRNDEAIAVIDTALQIEHPLESDADEIKKSLLNLKQVLTR